MTETIPTTTPSLSKEEQAFLMKALWEALQMPPWNRDDLIDLGKLIFAKKSLKEVATQEEKKFARLFPHLVIIVNHLGAKIMAATAESLAIQVAAATSPTAQAPVAPLPRTAPPTAIVAPPPQAPAPNQVVPTLPPLIPQIPPPPVAIPYTPDPAQPSPTTEQKS